MRQFKKQWNIQWNGHRIRVAHHADWLGRSEAHLSIDGVSIHRYTGSVWSGETIFESEFEDENGPQRVKVKMGAGSLRRICHIYVNNELIGGDVHRKFPLSEAEIEALPVPEQRRLLKRQRLDFLFVMPAFTTLFYFLIKTYLFPTVSPFMFFQIAGIMFPQILRINRKIRELPPENLDKNPTSI